MGSLTESSNCEKATGRKLDLFSFLARNYLVKITPVKKGYLNWSVVNCM